MTIPSRPITSAAMEGLSNCPLMKLPFEIRQSIYDLYYAEASDLVFGVTNSNRLRVHLWCKGLLNLPLVCKELYVASFANLPPSALIGNMRPKIRRNTPAHLQPALPHFPRILGIVPVRQERSASKPRMHQNPPSYIYALQGKFARQGKSPQPGEYRMAASVRNPRRSFWTSTPRDRCGWRRLSTGPNGPIWKAQKHA